ncbi:hypothetical protein Hanom_Chr16g01508271 [Helianthus anomalus]
MFFPTFNSHWSLTFPSKPHFCVESFGVCVCLIERMVVEFGDNQYYTIIISLSVFFQQTRRTPASMPAVNRRPHPPHLLPPRTTLTRIFFCFVDSFSVVCEQSSKGGSDLDVWLDRIAMIGFAVAISVEISTGKGLFEFRSVYSGLGKWWLWVFSGGDELEVVGDGVGKKKGGAT